MTLKQKQHGFLIALLLLFFCYVARGPAQTASINQKRLDRDLRIMEGILDKLFEKKTFRHFVNGNTEGIYLEDFGIVFHLNQESFISPLTRMIHQEISGDREETLEVLKEQQEELQKELEEVKILEDSKHPEADDRRRQIQEKVFPVDEKILVDFNKKTIEEAIEKLKENMTFFFQNYTSAIGQLKSQDRITVLVHLTGWEFSESENPFLIGWITRKDLDLYRQNQMSASDFKNCVHFQTTDAKRDIDTDIGIMTEIFHRAMDTSFFAGGSFSNGVYLDGFGAVFFMNIPAIYFMDSKNSKSFTVITGIEKAITAYKYSNPHDNEKEMKNQLQQMEDDLFELMASYGHTLRLNPEEYIVLNIGLGQRLFAWKADTKEPSRVILQLQKKDLDDYNRGVLSLNGLRKKLISRNF